MLSFFFFYGSFSYCSQLKENIENEYLIAFLRNGNLWIMNEEGKNQEMLTNKGNIIAFITKNRIIYYAEKDSINLKIKSIDISNKKKEYIATIKRKKYEYFESELNYKGLMSWIDENILGIAGDFICCDEGYKKAYFINLDKKTIQTKDFNNYFSKFKIVTSVEFTKVDTKTDIYFTRKVGDVYELFYSDSQSGKEIRLSNTQAYSPRECWGEVYDSFWYYLTPNGKVIFSFIESCGDLAHYILYAVNKDGSKQIQLDDDFLLGYDAENYDILRTNREFAIVVYDKNLEMNILIKIEGDENKKSIIAYDVSHFELIR